MKQPKLLLLSIIFLLASFNIASGCVCTGQTPTVQQSFDKAEVVFPGKIIRKEKSRVLFKVERFWKGISTNKIYIFNGNTSCGANFREDGKRWLIYASMIQLFNDEAGKIASELVLDILPCNRTKELANAKEDLKVLGEGKIL